MKYFFNFWFKIGKADYIGLNYYTANYATHRIGLAAPSFYNDQDANTSSDPKWPRAKSTWLYSVPEGLTAMLKYFLYILSKNNTFLMIFLCKVG